MKQICGLKYLHHPYSFPRSSPPSWAGKVDRWHQLDAYSFGMIDAYASLQDRLERPGLILLASPSASNDADRHFVLSGVKSPAKMVHTLPNVRSSSLVKFMGWGGPVLCIQKDPQTLLTALVEGLDFLDSSCRNLMIWGVVNEALFHRRHESTLSHQPHSGVEGEALTAMPLEGATRAPGMDGPSAFEAHVFSLTYLASEEKTNQDFPYLIQRAGDDPSLTCSNDELLLEWLSKPQGDFAIGPQITLSPN